MDRKNTLLLTVIAIATLLVAVVGATFAYFTAQIDPAATTEIKVTTSTSDSLLFDAASISLLATQENFGQDDEDLSETATATARLTANDNDEEGVDYCYTVTVSLPTAAAFVYTTAEQTPELLLHITKKVDQDEKIALIDTMDITTKTGDIQIPTTVGGTDYTHHLIAAKGATTEHVWETTVTLVNLDSNQQDNTNRKFTASITFENIECPTTGA